MTEQSQKEKRRSIKPERHRLKNLLVEGEEVIERAVISPAIYWKAVAVLCLAVFFALVFAIELGILLAVTAVLMIIHAVLKKEILMLVLTNKRMLFRYGILQVDVVDIRFSKIESIELERMPPGYLMGYSNVIIMGTGNRLVVRPYVANGPEIRQSYNRLTLSDDDAL